MKRKILIVTERRADFSKFRPILKEIQKSRKLEYFLVVTGSHLLKEHGYTINEIKNDGFKIFSKYQMYLQHRKDTAKEMVSALGISIIELSKVVSKVQPDIILAGFDIGANFAISIVGSHMNKIVAHLEGGEVTGTIDESIRHATTKFSHLHFTTNIQATNRLVKLGENPKFIFTVGNPSLDSIKNVPKMDKSNLEDEFELDMSRPYVIVMQHTVTTEINDVEKNIILTLKAISELGLQAIIIHGNADFGSKKISAIIKKSKFKHHKTIPFVKYINLLKNCAALVGNSSSGKMEAPFLKIPTINVGTRQSGRLSAPSVIDVSYNKNEIKSAIRKTIFDKKFLSEIKKQKNIYGNGNSSKKIVKILETINLDKIPIQKKLTY